MILIFASKLPPHLPDTVQTAFRRKNTQCCDTHQCAQMQSDIKEYLKKRLKYEGGYQRILETLPEAQRTQGLESTT